ncbi:MAG: dual specificity protein phosphatase family protein [Deltaproteobacteria bacterium]|nr:dual specificity protein phosphatase family protein [Deltaproteobacteria bacterium]MCB9788264.1 dual specificity protein phosphatase family protein [Deltaproteobacteria bacterium]
MEHFTALDGALCVGSHPHAPEHFTALARDAGVQAVVSLQSDEDLASRGLSWNLVWQLWTRVGVAATRVPISDFDPVDLARRLDGGVAAVAAHVDAGRRVFIHCNAGLNRSPSVAIAFVALHRGVPLDLATTWVMERHRAMPYQDVLVRWARDRGLPLRAPEPGAR